MTTFKSQSVSKVRLFKSVWQWAEPVIVITLSGCVHIFWTQDIIDLQPKAQWLISRVIYYYLFMLALIKLVKYVDAVGS